MDAPEKTQWFRSNAPFIVGLAGGTVVSEWQTSKDAVKALSDFAKKHPNADTAIYRKTLDGWEVF